MSEFSSHLLLAALSGSDTEATASWREWRRSVDIQNISWPELQFIPILNGRRLDMWLSDDLAAGVLKGIVRRAWSEAQVKLAFAREVEHVLTQAGCASVTVIGPAGSYLRNLHLQTVRPISEIRLLIPRQHLPRACEALKAEGWQPCGEISRGDGLDWSTHALFLRGGTGLYLHWRVLNVHAPQARECEREFLSDHRIVQAMGARYRILAPGHALLEILAGRAGHESADVIPWQAEASMVPRDDIDWIRWTHLAARFQPQAFDRISTLRAMGIDFPVLHRPEVFPSPQPARWEVLRTCKRRAGRWARRLLAVLERN
jgi:hypothetical protein